MQPVNLSELVGAEHFNLELLSKEFSQKDFEPLRLVKIIPRIGPFEIEPIDDEGPYVITIRKEGVRKIYKFDRNELNVSGFYSVLKGNMERMKGLRRPFSKETASQFWGIISRCFVSFKNAIAHFPEYTEDIVKEVTAFLAGTKDELERAAKILGFDSYSVTIGLTPSITLTSNVSKKKRIPS